MAGIDDYGWDELPPLITGGSGGSTVYSASPADVVDGIGNAVKGIDFQRTLDSALNFFLQRDTVDAQRQLAQAQQRAAYGYLPAYGGAPAQAGLGGLMPLLLVGGVVYLIASRG